MTSSPDSSPDPSRDPHRTAEPGDGLSPGTTAFADVAVAGVWREPRGFRDEVDQPAVTNPVDPDAWNRAMGTAEREWLSRPSRLDTQVLYGAPVEIEAVDGDWVEVVALGQATPADVRGYPGWMPAGQLVVDPDYEEALGGSQLAVVTSQFTTIHSDAALARPLLEVSVTTVLPVAERLGGVLAVQLPGRTPGFVAAEDVTVQGAHGAVAPAGSGGAQTAPDGSHPTRAELIATAERFLGLRYLWAGMSAWGLDCSGFSGIVYRIHGIDIPRDAGDQAMVGHRLESKDQLHPGDLVFFAQPGGTGPIHHVAVYHGDGDIIHAPNSDRDVRIENMEAFDVRREFCGGVRLVAG